MEARWFAGVLLLAAALAGCTSAPAISEDAVFLSAVGADGTDWLQMAPQSAPPIPLRKIDLVAEPPERGYRTIGYVLVFIEKPIPGLTTNVANPWRWCNPPSARLVRESGGSIDTTVIAGRDMPGSVQLHEALQSRAARMGANAVIARDSGIDQHGRLWASGIAIAR